MRSIKSRFTYLLTYLRRLPESFTSENNYLRNSPGPSRSCDTAAESSSQALVDLKAWQQAEKCHETRLINDLAIIMNFVDKSFDLKTVDIHSPHGQFLCTAL